MTEPFAVGIDIGGTKIAFALLHQDGEVIDFQQLPVRGNQTVAETISEMAIQIELMTSNAHAPLAGIGIGCPGQINSKTGLVKNAVNLGWHDVNLVEGIQARLPLKVPVFLKKDADANLLGEYHYGAAQGYADVLFIGIGSGLGCSFISDHRLVEGATNTAGGIGHIQLEGNPEICSCGLRGCAESLISGPGLVKRAKILLGASSAKSALGGSKTLTPALILQAAVAGDEIADQALADLSSGLGKIMAICIALVNPELIVIGGGLGLAAFDQIVPPAITEMKLHSLPHTYENLQIVPAGLRSSAVGAASLVWFSNTNSTNEGGEVDPV